MDSGEYVKRVAVSRSGQSLMWRVPDLSVSRLAAVFKVRMLRVSIVIFVFNTTATEECVFRYEPWCSASTKLAHASPAV